jgi:hypothetical protein
VVRFTDVTQEGIDRVVSRVEQSDGPPPGVEATGMRLLFDEGQGTALFVAFFDSEQDMRDADAVFGQMDPSETPGTRASVDHCEIKIKRDR